jgi:MFS family permease
MKLNYRRTILIGLAFLSITTFWQFYDNEIPKILKYNFNLGETLTGVIMALDNVLAIFLLPLFGTLSDKTSTRIGKRMPYILFGSIAAIVLFLVLMLLAKPSGNLLLFISVLFLLLIAMGTYRSPAVSLMPDLTPAPLRSAANAVINLMGALGGVFTLVMTMLLLKGADDPADTQYTPLVFSIVLCMTLSIIILMLTINEKKISKEISDQGGLKSLGDKLLDEELVSSDKTSQSKEKLPKDVFVSLVFLLFSVSFWFMAYNAVTTAYTRYVTEVWHLEGGSYAGTLMIATVAAVLSYIPIGAISGKFGRKKIILLGVVLMSLCYLAAAFMSTYSGILNIFFALIGIGWAAINVNSYPMVVEMSKGSDIGKYTGTYYTFSMAAQIFTPILSGFLLEHFSYRTLFPYAFVFSTLAFFTMLMVRHGDVRQEKTK